MCPYQITLYVIDVTIVEKNSNSVNAIQWKNWNDDNVYR